MSQYLNEFRTQWRAIASATIGLTSGLMMNSYAAAVMVPHLATSLGWSKADLAAVQVMAIATVFAFPFVGRLADVFGARRTALVGIVSSPLLFLGFSMMNSIWTYVILFGLQVVLLTTTTPPIYCRVIVEYFKQARGLALAIAASGPPLAAVIGGPLLNNFVIAHGWRAGYLALMVFTVVGGLAALLLMPAETKSASRTRPPSRARQDYAFILKSPAFWLLVVSTLLCNLPQAVLLTQLNLMIAEQGVVGRAASIMVSAYAGGMLVGRFISGFALDRFPARLVATAGLCISALGLWAMGTIEGSVTGLAIAVLAIGFSFGAEADILAYLIVRQFGVRVFSSVHGMLAASVAVSSALGAGLLSLTLSTTGDSYQPFLLGTGLGVLAGALLLLLLPKPSDFVDEADETSR